MNRDANILNYWFEKRNLSPATRELYTYAITQYSNVIGKTITELHDEADDEEENGIRLKRRKYSNYIIEFKKYLAENNKSEQTIRLYLTGVKSFYQANDIRPPEITMRKGEMVMEKNYGHLLTKEEIQKMAAAAYPRERAIIYIMALSGMSQREVRDLTLKKFLDSVGRSLNKDLETFEELFRYEEDLIKDTIILLEITRKKVHYRYHTFIPPQATLQILIYLKGRINGENERVKINNYEDPLFVMSDGSKLTKRSVTGMFNSIGQRCGFKHEYGSYRSWRSHGLRKYFISTIINSLGDHVLADYLAGHKIDSLKRSYWYADPQVLKEKYLEALKYLSIENIKIHDITTEDKKRLTELENSMTKKDIELEDTKNRLKRLEKYFKEREGIDKLEKP
jgi:integrase